MTEKAKLLKWISDNKIITQKEIGVQFLTLLNNAINENNYNNLCGKNAIYYDGQAQTKDDYSSLIKHFQD